MGDKSNPFLYDATPSLKKSAKRVKPGPAMNLGGFELRKGE